MDAWIIWIIVAVLLVILEVLTQMLLAICLGAGALAAMITALAGGDFVWQIVAMAVAAILFYCIAFPLYRKYHNGSTAETARTGMDALLGRRAIITAEIAPGGVGRARIDGDSWQVVAPSAQTAITVGSEVVVTDYNSNILTVDASNA